MKMISPQKVFLFIALLINSNLAINLNIFSFNKSPMKNETKLEKISIQPTATLTSSIKITKAPSPIVSDSHIPDLISQVGYEKYELENETETADSSPEVPTASATHKPPTGQEIDETRNSPRYSVVESVEEVNNSKHFLEKIKIPAYFSSFPKVTLPKLPSFHKRKTVTFTETVISKFTKYEKVYPSCIKLENVKSVCDGTFITIQPTPTLWNQNIPEATLMNFNDSNDTYDVIDPSENRRKRHATLASRIETSKKSNPKIDLIEPSEMDYEFESFDIKKPTPTSEKLLNSISKPAALIESLLMNEPKFEFVTKHVNITVVEKITDYGTTATIVAYNCVPKNINLKTCQKSIQLPPSIPLLPIVYSKKNVTTLSPVKEKQKNELKNSLPAKEPEKIIPTVPPTSNKPYNIIDELNRYLIMNGDRLIYNSGGFEAIDLNAESTIVEPRYSSQDMAKLMKKK